jgi:predicted DNA-binding ribbon-helix-helix protein
MAQSKARRGERDTAGAVDAPADRYWGAMARASGVTIKKRSVLIAGHSTSLSLEPEFWSALRDIAGLRGTSLNRLVASVDAGRAGNLSSALRVFVLECYRRGELVSGSVTR